MASIGLCSIVLLVLVPVSADSMGTSGQSDARADLERLAAKLIFFNVSDVIYDRDDLRFIPDEVAKQYRRAIIELSVLPHKGEELVRLLKHPDPKVRTLALAALYSREDPKLLPHFVPLVSDQALTFPRSEVRSSSQVAMNAKTLPPLEAQSVGEVAKRLVTFYLERAQYYYGIDGRPPHGGFDEYWSRRKDREFCASWFAVQLARAGQGTRPTPKGRVDQIRAVRKRIDKLARTDRSWTVLWLNGEDGSDALVSEDELVAMCKELGPVRLLLMLQRKIPSDDPDVQPRPMDNWPYRRMTLFVLRHAAAVLRPDDADALLACERWERDYLKHDIGDPTLSAWWVIAVAELKREPSLIRVAFDRFTARYEGPERSDLAQALWRLAGPGEIPFLVEWFYGEDPDLNRYSHQRATFLKGVARQRIPENRRLIAALVMNKRFDSLDWQSFSTLIDIVNGWSDKPVVERALVESARHPLGDNYFHLIDSVTRKEYPKETAALERVLEQCREKVRAAVMNWE